MAKTTILPYGAPQAPAEYDISLRFTDGSSDKVYELAMEPAGDGYHVMYANAKFGGTLKRKPKTSAPVSWEEAAKLLNKELSGKVAKGYLPQTGTHLGATGAVEAASAREAKSSGRIPMLLNPVDEDDLDTLIDDDRYVAEPKYDGERRLLIVRGGEAIGGNRLGQVVPLSLEIAEAALSIGVDIEIDGEDIRGTFVCWDVLSIDGNDVSGHPLLERRAILEAKCDLQLPYFQMAEQAHGAEAKRSLLSDVATANGEGVVFKRKDAAYSPGRPASGGAWHKHKFWKELSAVVSAINTKRSVALSLMGPEGPIAVGNVTVPANQDIPEVGSVVEVSYLYAYPDGSLFQPTLIKVRNDILPEECLEGQRVYRADVNDAEVIAFPKM